MARNGGKNTSVFHTAEWAIFCAGVAMSLLLIGAAWYFFDSRPEKVKTFGLVLVVHTFGGRAAGIGLCILNGVNHFWTIAYNFYLEVLIVCFTYSISVLSINNYIKLRVIRYYVLRLERKARKYRDKIERYGWLGLLLFVMTPLPVTGPVVGSIIGYLLKFRVSKNFSATFLGTLAAIVLWTLFFDLLEQHLNVIRAILAGIIVLVLLSYARDIKNLFSNK